MTHARYITPLTTSRGFGEGIIRTARGFGKPLMPWQIHAARLIGETDERGALLHPLVVITVPRQSGKTMLMWAVMLQRLVHRPQARVWYTAQKGMHARDQLTEMADALDLSPFKTHVHCKRGAGDTSITLTGVGSRIKAFAPTPDSLHGKQSDLVVIDEGWFFPEDQGAALMGAIKATQNSRDNGQVIIVSTMGTADSTWFHDFVDRGRAGDPSVCLIDYGLPLDSPVTDELIYAAHPSADRNNFTYAKMLDAKAVNSPGEYLRAYGNRPTSSAELIWPMDQWTDAQTSESIPLDVQPCFAAAVSIDRSQTVIAAAAVVDGVPRTAVIDARPGTDWAAHRLRELDLAHPNRGVHVPPRGPSATLATDAALAGVPLADTESDEDVRAAADMYDRIMNGTIEIGAHPELDMAVANAAWRNVGDGARAFGRRASSGSIAALEAVSLAAYQAAHRAEMPEPMIYTG